MAKFRKKPIEIEAFHFTSIAAFNAEVSWPNQAIAILPDEYKYPFARLAARVKWDGDTCIIPTLEGDMKAEIGDWIIRGIKGEFYPIKDAIFAATYDEVK